MRTMISGKYTLSARAESNKTVTRCGCVESTDTSALRSAEINRKKHPPHLSVQGMHHIADNYQVCPQLLHLKLLFILLEKIPQNPIEAALSFTVSCLTSVDPHVGHLGTFVFEPVANAIFLSFLRSAARLIALPISNTGIVETERPAEMSSSLSWNVPGAMSNYYIIWRLFFSLRHAERP